MNKIEYYCEGCIAVDCCAGCTTCNRDLASVTCAKNSCYILIKYPIKGGHRPKYCKNHTQTEKIKFLKNKVTHVEIDNTLFVELP